MIIESLATDGIYPTPSQKTGETVIKHFMSISRASLSLGNMPRAWNESRVIFILNAEKVSYTSAWYFFPISLPIFNVKAVERVVERYI